MSEPPPLESIKFGSIVLFVTWCKWSIKCDHCGELGGRSTRSRREFICQTCARLFFST